MDKAEIERERISFLPVRELITIDSVREQRLAGNERIFIIRGHLDETPMTYRDFHTPDAFKASLCKLSIGRPSLWVTWQRDPFNKYRWNEHNLINVETNK